MLKEKSHQPRILYLAKLPFKSEIDIKALADKQKLVDFATRRSALKEMLKIVLQREGKLYRLETQIYIKIGRTFEKE